MGMHVRRQRTDPVFVDRTGRRRRLFMATGAAGGVAMALVTLALIAGFTGAGPGYLPTLPESAGDQQLDSGEAGQPSAAVRPVSPSPRIASPATGARPTPAPSPTQALPAASPTPTPNSHRRVPTHTPNNRPSKAS